MFCHGGSGNSVDDPIARGEGRSHFCTTGTGNSSGATTPVPEPELTVEVGDRPADWHLEETVPYSVDDYYTEYSPSRPRVLPHSYTRSPSFYTSVREQKPRFLRYEPINISHSNLIEAATIATLPLVDIHCRGSQKKLPSKRRRQTSSSMKNPKPIATCKHFTSLFVSFSFC